MNIMNRLLVCLLATMFVVSVGAVGVNALNFKTINDPLYFWIDGTVAENTHTDFVDVTILPLNDIRWNTDPGLEGTYKFDPTGSGILEGTPHKNDWGLHTATIYAEHNATDNNTKTIDILVTNKGDDGALAIDGDKIKVSGKTMDFGEKLSKKFKLGDTLELEFDLENTYDEDADDIDIEDIDITAWIEKDGKTFGEEVDLDDEFTIDAEEKEEDIALNIEIPKDEDDEGTFTLYVVAEGTDSNGNPAVEVFYGQIEIDREKHELLIDEDEISWEPSEIKPGEKVKLEVPIYNIGSSSKEEEIKLTVKNDDLKIESTVDVVEELDRADDDTAEIWINIPRTVKSGKYFLDFEVDYKSSEDKYSIPIEIVGGVDADALEGLVSLTLSQTSMSAAPGSMSKFSVTLENTGDAEEEFDLKCKNKNKEMKNLNWL